MKLKTFLLCALLASTFIGCAQEESNVEVSINSSALPLIPATAISCAARENAGSDVPTSDISASYFKIPTITFKRKKTDKQLIIAFIRINIPIPGGTAVSCEYGGDNLAALHHDNWWKNTGKEALIDIGVDSFTTTCALYCGGINSDNPYVASGTMEVFGLERNPSNQEETPVRVQTAVTIQSF